MKHVSVAFVLAAFVAPAVGQPLVYVRVAATDGPALAASLERQGLDVVEGGVRRHSVELMVSPEELASLEARGLRIEVLAESRPFRDIQRQWQAGFDMPPPGYLTLPEIITEMNNAAAAFPAICQVVNLTTTYGTPPTANGRHVMAVKISDNVGMTEDEPVFLLAACHHAREIGTPVVALDTIARLTGGYGSDPVLTDLVNRYEIWIIPVANPDGYDYMFNVNNNWRKNRRPNTGGSYGVDQNRNYPLGWSAPCAGSTTPSSETYKGPSAASEPETQAIMALSKDRHVTKVLDYHSYGRETLYGFNCLSYPFTTFLQQQASQISSASGYGGATRLPSAEGEHPQWQLGDRGALAFLTEIGTSFQPTYASAQAEANMVWGGTLWLLQRPITISGHVRNAVTGQPVAAAIRYIGVTFTNGEKNASEPRFGRYHAFLPAGAYTLEFSAPGYITQTKLVQATANTEQVVDVLLAPVSPPCYVDCNADGVLNLSDFGCFQTRYALGCP